MENYQISMPSTAAPFAMLYGPVITDLHVPDNALRLYALLWCLGDRFKEGWHSQALLADLLNVSARTIRRALKCLAEAELIVTTDRRPRPTLIRIEDPARIYGVHMIEFYDHVKRRSAALRQENSGDASNRTNLSGSIGQNCPVKNIKEEDKDGADFRPRASVDDSIEGVEKQRASTPAKRFRSSSRKKKEPILRTPTLKPQKPSRWGGRKFYLYCLDCARTLNVPVRDPDAHMQKAPPRFVREMNYAIEAFRDKGYDKQQFCDLLTMVFTRWGSFAQYFKKQEFSVYDLRYSILELCALERRISGARENLEDMEDFEDEPSRPAERIGQVIYDDEEED